MNDDFRKVLSRIRKLLEMTKSPYPEEAATALSMAKELMLKYKIEMNDINGVTEDIIEIDFGMTKNQDAEICLAYWLGKAFFVKALNVKTKQNKNIVNSIRFIGTKTDVACSTYIYAYMVNLIDIHSKEYFNALTDEERNKSTKTKIKADYAYGFVIAVNEKLQKIEEERLSKMPASQIKTENALVLTSNALVERYMKEKYPNRNEGKDKTIQTNIRHAEAGYIEGCKHGIYKGIKTSKRDRRYLDASV